MSTHKCHYCNDTGSIACRSRDGQYAFAGPVPDDARGYFDADCWYCDSGPPPKLSAAPVVTTRIGDPKLEQVSPLVMYFETGDEMTKDERAAKVAEITKRQVPEINAPDLAGLLTMLTEFSFQKHNDVATLLAIVAELEAENTDLRVAMQKAICDARTYLYAAIVKSNARDDQIIMDHVRAAYTLLENVKP